MKFKTLLVVLVLSLFFLGTQSSAFAVSDTIFIVYDTSAEASEQVEEIEDNRNFFSPIQFSSYIILDSSVIVHDPSFYPENYFFDIHKPPIFS